MLQYVALGLAALVGVKWLQDRQNAQSQAQAQDSVSVVTVPYDSQAITIPLGTTLIVTPVPMGALASSLPKLGLGSRSVSDTPSVLQPTGPFTFRAVKRGSSLVTSTQGDGTSGATFNVTVS